MSRLGGNGRAGRRTPFRWAVPLVGLALAAAAVVIAVGVSHDGATTAAPATPSSAVTGGPANPAEEDPAGSGPTRPPVPATEAAAATVVVRQGVPASARTVTVSTTDFRGVARWSDGLSARVTGAHQQVTTGKGPGDRAGQPQTVFTLELTNRSATGIDVNAVVVQARYGTAGAQASPLYDKQTTDFGGTLAPGATATAVYSFAIPADQLGSVVVSVDVDGYRYPAVFSGAVPTK